MKSTDLFETNWLKPNGQSNKSYNHTVQKKTALGEVIHVVLSGRKKFSSTLLGSVPGALLIKPIIDLQEKRHIRFINIYMNRSSEKRSEILRSRLGGLHTLLTR